MNQKLLKILPVAGALPFIGCATLLLVGINSIPILGSTISIMLSYGLAIASFMAGVHWGQFLSGAQSKIYLLLASNAITLCAWFGFLLLPLLYFCLTLIVLFIVLYAIDRHLHVQKIITLDYANTRAIVTTIVCISLVIAAYTLA